MTLSFFGTLAQMNSVRAQADLALGVPHRSTVIGGPDALPVTCAGGGCAGWTDHALDVPVVSGSGYALAVPSALEFLMGRVPVGVTRLLVLAIGESGMVGGSNVLASPLPAGYPNTDGTVWSFDASHRWVPLTEKTHEPGANPLETPYNIPTNQLGYSFVGQFCWRLQAALGSAYEVGLIPCGRSGTTSADWAVGGSYYNAALARTQLALQQPRTVLHSICMEQGINDASQGLAVATGWASRWAATEAGLRAGLGNTVCPVYFSRHTTAQPVTGSMTGASWTQLLAEQDAYASANRFAVQKPEGPFVDANIHLDSDAQGVLATRYMTVATAHPGVTS